MTVSRVTDPFGTLLTAGKPSTEVNPPLIGIRIDGNASKGNGKLRAPTQVVLLRTNFPNRIPIHLRSTHIRIDQSLAFRSIGIGSKVIPVPSSTKWINENEKVIVSTNRGIPLHDARPNLIRLRIKTTHPHEEKIGVTTKTNLGLFSLSKPFVGTALTEVLDNR